MRAAREFDIGGGKLIDGSVEKPHLREPPSDILASIAKRNSCTTRCGQVDLPPVLVQLLGNLEARLARPHHQNRTWRKRVRVTILARMDLLDVCGQPITSYR